MQALARLARGQQLQPRLAAALLGSQAAAAAGFGRLEHSASDAAEAAAHTDALAIHAEDEESLPSSSGGGEHAEQQQQQRQRWQRQRRQGYHSGDEGGGGGGQQRLWPVSVHNVGRTLTRQDIVDFFEGCNLTPEEVRAQYSNDGQFRLERYWANFPSEQDRERALARHAAFLGSRRALVQAATVEEFRSAVFNPMAMSSRGRYLVVTGLSDRVTSEDLQRFFHGYALHAKSVTFVREKRGQRSTQGQAIVRFDNAVEAHRALRCKQGGICVDAPVHLQLLL